MAAGSDYPGPGAGFREGRPMMRMASQRKATAIATPARQISTQIQGSFARRGDSLATLPSARIVPDATKAAPMKRRFTARSAARARMGEEGYMKSPGGGSGF